jgi:hypothetical protein
MCYNLWPKVFSFIWPHYWTFMLVHFKSWWQLQIWLWVIYRFIMRILMNFTWQKINFTSLFVVKLKLNIKWNGFEFGIQVKDLKRTKEFPKGFNKWQILWKFLPQRGMVISCLFHLVFIHSSFSKLCSISYSNESKVK